MMSGSISGYTVIFAGRNNLYPIKSRSGKQGPMTVAVNVDNHSYDKEMAVLVIIYYCYLSAAWRIFSTWVLTSLRSS